MKRLLKWIGIALAGLLALAVMATIVAFALATGKFNWDCPKKVEKG